MKTYLKRVKNFCNRNGLRYLTAADMTEAARQLDMNEPTGTVARRLRNWNAEAKQEAQADGCASSRIEDQYYR